MIQLGHQQSYEWLVLLLNVDVTKGEEPNLLMDGSFLQLVQSCGLCANRNC